MKKHSVVPYRDLFQKTGAVMVLIDTESAAIIDANPAACAFYGYSREKMTALKVYDILLLPREFVMQELREMVPETNKTIVVRQAIANGEVRDVEVLSAPVTVDGKKILHCIIHDVTQWKKVEEDLKLKEKFLDIVSDSLFVADSQGRILYCNEAMSRILGYSVNEIRRMTIYDISAEDPLSIVGERIKAIEEKGEIVFKTRNRRKDGVIMYVDVRACRVKVDGAAMNLYSVRDISEAWRMNDRLVRINECFLHFSPDYRENIQRLTTFCGELLGSTFAMYNRIENIMLCSQASWKLPQDFVSHEVDEGHLCLEVIKKGGDDVVVHRHLQESSFLKTDRDVAHYGFSTYLGKAVRCGNEFVGSLCVVYQDDYEPQEIDLRIMSIIAAAIGVEEERRHAEEELLETARDLAQRNSELSEMRRKLYDINLELEQRVEEKTEKIAQLLKQKTEFMNQLGHDLKTPLTPLVALLPIIEKKVDDPLVRNMIHVCADNAEYMHQLILRVLELFRSNASTLSLKMEEIILYEAAEDVLTARSFGVNQDDVIVRNMIPHPIRVMADRLRLKEVLANLLDNSFKYMPLGGTITIAAVQDVNEIRVSVTDTGIGLAIEFQKRIFEEFFKVDASRHDRHGSGLGLAICRRIIDEHGGKIWAESEGPGHGMTVYFVLPDIHTEKRVSTT